MSDGSVTPTGAAVKERWWQLSESCSGQPRSASVTGYPHAFPEGRPIFRLAFRTIARLTRPVLRPHIVPAGHDDRDLEATANATRTSVRVTVMGAAANQSGARIEG